MGILHDIGKYFLMIKLSFSKTCKREVLYKQVFKEINDLIIDSIPIVLILSYPILFEHLMNHHHLVVYRMTLSSNNIGLLFDSSCRPHRVCFKSVLDTSKGNIKFFTDVPV